MADVLVQRVSRLSEALRKRRMVVIGLLYALIRTCAHAPRPPFAGPADPAAIRRRTRPGIASLPMRALARAPPA
jgi:hypothetical protein